VRNGCRLKVIIWWKFSLTSNVALEIKATSYCDLSEFFSRFNLSFLIINILASFINVVFDIVISLTACIKFSITISINACASF